MSNYTQTTFFAPKDSLPQGNPAKTIFGAAYDVEFGNISIAIASKFDVTTNTISNVLAFTGAVTFSANVVVSGDTTVLRVRNTATTAVVQLSTVEAWVGSGVDNTDAALGATATLNIYATNSVNPTMQITSTAILGRGPVAAGLVDMTPDTGTFTITYTGFTANPTATAAWARTGNVVTLFLPGGTGTSNATTFTATGLPAAINPVRAQLCCITNIIDNSVSSGPACATVNPGETITFSKGPQQGVPWTNSGTKGIQSTGCNISYILS